MKIRELLENKNTADDFNQWFGKSKVVDENNKPKKVYRGVYGDNDKKAGVFYTDNPNEASAYTHSGDIPRAEKLKNSISSASGIAFIGKRVEHVGIIGDISTNNEIWSTDNGVVLIDKNKNIKYYNDIVADDNTYNNGTIILKKGNNSHYEEKIKELENFTNRHYSKGEAGRVYPVYLKIENPKYLSPLEANIITKRFGKETEQKGKTLINQLKKQGYDGIITQSDEASQFGPVADEIGIPNQYIPFSENQVRTIFKN